MPNTSLGFPYPTTASNVRPPQDIQAAVEAIDDLLTSWLTFTSYSPTWTGATTNPVIGNGSISAKYVRMGDLVFAFGLITMGSTTTYGTGEWRLSLPVTSASLAGGGGGAIVDASSSSNNEGVGINFYSVTQIRFVASGGNASSLVPFTPFQTGDTVNWWAAYEAA